MIRELKDVKPTVQYAGVVCHYFKTYGDDDLDDAQEMINSFRAEGKKACVIHEGKDLHHLYVEKKKSIWDKHSFF